MKRMHDKKELGGASRHFIHFVNGNDTYRFEFYDNHSGRYTKADLGNIMACGKAGMYNSDFEGKGAVLCLTSSTTQIVTYKFNTSMSFVGESAYITFNNVTGFADEE